MVWKFNQNVRRLKIAMDDVVWVNVIHTLYDLPYQYFGLNFSQKALTLTPELSEVVQISTITILHSQIVVILCGSGIVQPNHVFWLDFHHYLRLFFEFFSISVCILSTNLLYSVCKATIILVKGINDISKGAFS
jgi:hypothetical protein